MQRVFKKAVVALLTWEAKAVLKKFKPRIVAVVGNVGKTSAKDAVYAVLSQRYFVRKSEKSFNSEVGVPLTVLGCPNAWHNPLRWLENLFDGLVLILAGGRYPELLILEIGADRPGDIARIARWLSVDAVIVTALPTTPVHIEFFDSVEQVVEEKASILRSLNSSGSLILNADDETVLALRERVPATVAVHTYGFTESADTRSCGLSVLFEEGGKGFPVGIEGVIDCKGSQLPARVMGTIGSHSMLSLLAGCAAGKIFGIPDESIAEGLASYTPPQGRMRLIQGIKDSLIIDDTYNASPAATLAALEGLRLVTTAGRKIAVLGDMLELGRHSVEKHREVGKLCADVCDLLLTVGFRARDVAEGALEQGMAESAILQFEDAKVAGKELERLLEPGDCVLIKGSQSMRMERAVEEVMRDPAQAERLLVRQEPEWKKR